MSAPFLPPPSVPDYELLRCIGRGAYGEVWLSRSRATNAYRAVKIVHRRSFEHDRPFVREFEGILKFEPISRHHDSQVDILHVGRNEDYFYYVMELADDQATGGQIDPGSYMPRTLKSDLLLHGRLRFEECVRIGIALATALEHLHAHHLVHRDVKPSNIIFINGVPKLADIGLVTEVDATRSYVGTEGFAAPEGAGSPQADLYSLGKVLYEMATGKDRQQFPELPTQLRELPDRDGLMELNAVIARACRHDPKDRYAAAAAMRADLELLQGGKSLARLHRVEEKLRHLRRAAVIAFFVGLAITTAWLWQTRQTRTMRKLAADKGQLATENRERVIRLDVANGVREMAQGDFAKSLQWLTEALTLATNNPADSASQRIRIHQLLTRHPRLLHLLPHPTGVASAEFSPNESQVVTVGADSKVRVWNLANDEKPAIEFSRPGTTHARFTRNGRHLYVEKSDPETRLVEAALLDATTGQPTLAPWTNLSAVALSPDEHWIALGRTNGALQIVSLDSVSASVEATGHTSWIQSLSFSADSTQLASASRDWTTRRWNTSNGQPIGAYLWFNGEFSRAILSRDNSRVATVTKSYFKNDPVQFQTWDAATSTALANPIRGWGNQSLVAFDASGLRLLTCDREAQAHVWEVDSHVELCPPLQMNARVNCLALSPDGSQVALGSEAGEVRIWNIEAGTPAFPPLRNFGEVTSLRFNGLGNRLLTACGDGTVKIWDLAQPPLDGKLEFHSAERPVAAISPDGQRLLLGLREVPDNIRLIELENLTEVEAAGPGKFLYVSNSKILFDRSGRQWASGGETIDRLVYDVIDDIRSKVLLWRRQGSHIDLLTLPHDRRKVLDSFFSEDGSQLLTLSMDRVCRIWNTADGSVRRQFPWPDSDTDWVAVSPDLQTVVAKFHDEKGNHFCLRDVSTGKIIGPPGKNNPDISLAKFSPDGKRIVTLTERQHCRVWDVSSGEPISAGFKSGTAITALEWSPDGRRLLTAGGSPEIKVWDAESGLSLLAPLQMKTKAIVFAHFSPDGRFIVAGSDDNFAQVWDAITGEPITPALHHTDSLTEAFVTSKPRLVTVQNSGTVRQWDLSETSLSAADLRDYTRLLVAETARSSREDPAKAATQLRALRGQLPGMFAATPEQLRLWHQSQTEQTNSLKETEAAIFHLEKLAAASPADSEWREKLRRYRTLLVPPRAPDTPARLIDLSRAYTHSFELLRRKIFNDLPRGRQVLDGTEFDLRGLVKLNHRAERVGAIGPYHPSTIIPVHQRCRSLHFLQASEDDPNTIGSVVARWLIHYADGSTREWQVIYGKHLLDCFWDSPVAPTEPQNATIAWRGHAYRKPASALTLLFKSTWQNPQPDLEITSLEFRMGDTSMKPFVVAITAE